MTAEFFALPGKPVPYFLAAGEGERSHLFDQLFTVLLSADETDGQFGVFTMEAPRGDAIPVHSHADVHEIFFVLDAAGERTNARVPPVPPVIPAPEQLGAAAQQYRNDFHFDVRLAD